MTAMCCGEWGWTDRTVTNLDPAVWRNPSGFFGACTSWSRRASHVWFRPFSSGSGLPNLREPHTYADCTATADAKAWTDTAAAPNSATAP